MGNRGNIRVGTLDDIAQKQGAIYLYTHYYGSELPKTLQNALGRRLRWDDDAYLTRIIFCEMVRGEEAEETGFGISTRVCDNQHPILNVDCRTQKIRVGGKSFTFKEYCSLVPSDSERGLTYADLGVDDVADD